MKFNTILKSSLALAMAVGMSYVFQAQAQEKGAQRLMQVKTKAEADALKPDDAMVMVCAKCKTVWATRVKQGTKGAQILMENGQPTELIGTHACAGCNSTITVTGTPKAGAVELKHSCKTCGDDSAFCCAVKPGSGPTPGMKMDK